MTMYAQAIQSSEAGGWRGCDPRALGGLWRSMSGGGHRHGGTRGRHRRREYGGGSWGGFGGFPFGGFGPGGPFGRGRKARRGDIRTAALLLVAEEPRNGYQIMQEVEERSEGAWRPSPGSVYPALQQLEDEGLIRAEETDGKRVFRLTEEGQGAAKALADTAAPWETAAQGMETEEGALAMEVRSMIGQVAAAVAQAGNAAQGARAKDVMTNTRRTL